MDNTPDILAAAPGTKSDDLLVPAALPPPPPPPPKKGLSKGILLSIALFLLVTIPLSVKLIANQRQLADLRKQARIPACIDECQGDSGCIQDCKGGGLSVGDQGTNLGSAGVSVGDQGTTPGTGGLSAGDQGTNPGTARSCVYSD